MNHHQACNSGIKGLYAEARSLREIVLRRLATVGCGINERSLAKAETIVNARIGELIANPEYATLLDRHSGESQLLSLLVQACAAELLTALPLALEKRRRSRTWHDDVCRRKAEPHKGPHATPLRLVTENGELTSNEQEVS